MRLQHRVILLTGGARGMGAATVRRFIAEGASVAFGDVRDDLGNQLAAELGDQAMYLHLDVRQEHDWAQAVAATVKRFGKVDGLVNNAGIFGPGYKPLEDFTLDDYMSVVSVNQIGVFLGMRAAVPHIKEAGGGTIVNVSSTAGITGLKYAIAYVASKHAVTGMTKTASLELSPGIRVNSVHPGLIDTPLARGEGPVPGVEGDQEAGPRWGKPEEVADLLVFLTSDESSYCSGAEFVIDGGNGAGFG